MRGCLLLCLWCSAAEAGGRGSFFLDAQVGPARVQWGPAWTGANTSGRPVPLVPLTNTVPYSPQAVVVPVPVFLYAAPPPAPATVVIEREVVVERAPAEPAAPPPPQVIVIERPVVETPAAPAVSPPAAPPPPAELPKAASPRTPGPDVYCWTDPEGIVHYSTRPPGAGVKARKLATLAK